MVKEMATGRLAPYFSVIIPTYNRAHTLALTIESVIKQTYPFFEVIIVDDGSTDNTSKMVLYLNDKRIRYFFQKNGGVSAARNLGAFHSNGQWLTFLDSDDIVNPNWLMDFTKLSTNEDIDLMFCGMELKDNLLKQNRYLFPSKNYYKGKNWGFHNAGVWAVKKEFFKKVNGYDEALKFGENVELGIRLKALQPKVRIIEKINLIYNVSETGGSRNLEEIVRSNIIILNKHIEFFAQNSSAGQKLKQATGVALIRLGRINEARYFLWSGWKAQPYNLKAFARALLSISPCISKSVWKKEIS